jgi:hypothetical protein
MDTKEKEKVNEDIDTLKDDIRRVRNDFAATLRSLRLRAKNLAADSRQKVRTMVPGQPPVAAEHTGRPRRYYQRMPGWFPASIRVVAVTFALGAVAALLVTRRRRRIGGATLPESGRWQSRLAAVLPRARRWRQHRVSRTKRYKPAVRDRAETVMRRAARIKERLQR